MRIHEVGRRKLQRDIIAVNTTYGTIKVKVSKRGDEILTVTPEYEDCRKIAEEKNVPLKTVIEEAKAVFSRRDAEDAENK